MSSKDLSPNGERSFVLFLERIRYDVSIYVCSLFFWWSLCTRFARVLLCLGNACACGERVQLWLYSDACYSNKLYAGYTVRRFLRGYLSEFGNSPGGASGHGASKHLCASNYARCCTCLYVLHLHAPNICRLLGYSRRSWSLSNGL